MPKFIVWEKGGGDERFPQAIVAANSAESAVEKFLVAVGDEASESNKGWMDASPADAEQEDFYSFLPRINNE